MNIPTNNNKKFKKILERVNKNVEIQALWECSNIMAVNRLEMSDHGKTHVAIIANIAIKILRMLIEKGVTPSIVKDYKLTNDDAEVVVFLSSIFHDVGHIVHREDHHLFSVSISYDMLEKLLDGFYKGREKIIMMSEILHAIYSHEKGIPILTLEAGVVRFSDALDMKQGRARIPFKGGKIDIHSVSAMAIDEVEILQGDEKPILIQITMNNSAGIYQVDHLLKEKFKGTGLEPYVSVKLQILTEKEKRIIDKYEIK